MTTTKKTTKTKKSIVVAKKTTKTKKSTAVAKKPSTNTSAQMRVIIAKDILAQIESRRYCPAEGSWIAGSNMIGDLDCYIEDRLNENKNYSKIDIRGYVNKVKKCSVCALGAIFMSQVSKFGGVTFDGNFTPTSAFFNVFEDLDCSPLKKYFSVSQLELIEACFEGLAGAHSGDVAKSSDRVSAQAYYTCYKNATKRMITIMNNIIRNKGTFVPSQDLTEDMLIEAANFI